MLLEDDVVLLAGGTGRVGGPSLRAFLREGASVALLSRTRQAAEETIATHARGAAGRVQVVVADLLAPEDGARAVRETVSRFGRLDGRGSFIAVADSTLDDFMTNLSGFAVTNYNLMLPALRHMLAQDQRPGARSRGRLVVVTAGSSRTPQPRFGLMGAAKAAVNTFMLAIAREHKADGIVSNALVLGAVATEAAKDYLDAQSFAAASTPEELAETLAFLVSDRSSGINGVLLDHNAREVD